MNSTRHNLSKHNMKRTLTLLIVLGLIAFLLYGVSKIAPSHYPNAEIYSVKQDGPKVIEAVKKIKIEHPDLYPPVEIGLKDGISDSFRRDYNVYVYYPDTKEIVHFWIGETSEYKTIIGFIGINKGHVLGNWKDINEDFSKSENQLQKQRFEKEILNPIIEILNTK